MNATKRGQYRLARPVFIRSIVSEQWRIGLAAKDCNWWRTLKRSKRMARSCPALPVQTPPTLCLPTIQERRCRLMPFDYASPSPAVGDSLKHTVRDKSQRCRERKCRSFMTLMRLQANGSFSVTFDWQVESDWLLGQQSENRLFCGGTSQVRFDLKPPHPSTSKNRPRFSTDIQPARGPIWGPPNPMASDESLYFNG